MGVLNFLRQGGLSTAGWAVKDQAAKVIRLNEARQQASFADDVRLPDHLIKCAGPHAHRERTVPGLRLRRRPVPEEVVLIGIHGHHRKFCRPPAAGK